MPIKTREKMIEKILKSIFLTVGLFIVGSVLYSMFYIPLKEKEFIEIIEKKFNKTPYNYVLVRDVVTTEWDAVCAVHRYLSDEFFYNQIEALEKYGDYQEVVENNLPFILWPTFLGAYIFIKDKTLVESFVYNSYGIRFYEGKFNSTLLKLSVNNQKIDFLADINFGHERCIKRSNAVFFVKGQKAKYVVLENILNFKKEE